MGEVLPHWEVMNNTKDTSSRSQNSPSLIHMRAGQRHRDPLDYNHPYDSMRRYAELLALRHDCLRTRHSYYRAMRLLHEHFRRDPATLGEDQFRDYILYVKTRKAWKPKTIRQTVACARLFFCRDVGVLGVEGVLPNPHPRSRRTSRGAYAQPGHTAAWFDSSTALPHAGQIDLLRRATAFGMPVAHGA